MKNGSALLLSGILIAANWPGHSRAQEKAFPTELDRRALEEVVADAGEEPGGESDLPAALRHFPDVSGQTGILLVRRGTDVTESEVTFKQGISGGRYLVLTIRKKKDDADAEKQSDRHATDIIGHDAATDLYHLWRLLPEGGVAHLTGLADLKKTRGGVGAIPDPGGKERGGEDDVVHSEEITWHGRITGGKDDGRDVIAHSFAGEARAGGYDGGLSWSYSVLDDGRPVYRESGSCDAAPKTRPEPDPGDKEYAFGELNFRFGHPGERFTKVDPAPLNPDATLMFVDYSPMRVLTIIAEDNGPRSELDTDKLVAVAKTNLTATNTETEFGGLSPARIGGVPFQTFTATGKGKLGLKVATFHAVTSHNGFLYQIIFAVNDGDPAKVRENAIELVKNFHLLDPDRIAPGAGFVHEPKYASAHFGIEADFSEFSSGAWTEQFLRGEYPSATFAAHLPGEAGVVLFPVDLAGLEADDEALAEGLLPSMGVAYPDEVTSSKPHIQGNASGRKMSAANNWEGARYLYRLRILRNADTACLIAAYVPEKSLGDAPDLEKVLDAVKFTQPAPAAERSKVPRSQLLYDDAVNDIGLALYRRGEFLEAAGYFIAALELRPDNAAYFGNALDAFENQELFANALETFDKYAGGFKTNLELQSNRPHLLAALGRKEEAAEGFAELFSAGFQNEDRLLEYLQLLMGLERGKEAGDVIDTFVGDGGTASVRTRRWQHQIWAQTGKPEEAMEAARKLADEFPENPLLASDFITSLLDNGEAGEALTRIQKLRDLGGDAAQVDYLEGRAHLITKDYRKAKETFERASAAAPQDESIAEALASASALLGQGDNSSVKQEIEPVAIPDELAAQLSDRGDGGPEEVAEGFNTRTLRSLTGFHFERGAPVRRSEFRNVKVFNHGGVEDFKTLRFYFDPTYERAYVNQLDVFDPDGRKVASGSVDDYYVTAGNGNDDGMATTESILHVPVPGLKPGHTLRYVTTIEDRGGSDQFPFERFTFLSGGPPEPRAVFIRGDVAQIRSEESNGKFAKGSGADFAYWLLTAPPRYHYERSQPELEEFIPNLALGPVGGSWEEVGLTYIESVADRLGATKEAKELAAKLTDGLVGEDAKLRALLEWVQKEITYRAIEFGSRARTPDRTPRILANRYGDCKDHSLLAHQLLAAAGIETQLAVVNTGPPLRESIPSLDQFDHMILYAPGIGGGRFFDCTSKDQNLTLPAPENLGGKTALVFDPKMPRLVKIPEIGEGENIIRSLREMEFDPEFNDLLVNETVTFSGFPRGWMRGYLRGNNAADLRPNLQSVLGTNARFRLEEVTASGIDDFAKPLELKMRYRIRRALRQDGDTLGGDLPAVWETYFLQDSFSGERQTPFEISSPLVFQSSVRLKRPEGENIIGDVWKATDRKAPWVQFKQTPTGNEKSWILESTIHLLKGRHPAGKFGDYQADIEAILEAARGRLAILR